MSHRRAVAAGLSAVAALIALTTPSAGAAPSRSYHEYVALGDSWSADVLTTLPPATEFVPFDCAQSRSDYPHQVAEMLHVTTFRDATCGSATTVEMTKPQSLPLGGVSEPQFDKLTPTTDLVTLGIGGNDVGLAGDIESCLSLLPVNIPGTGCKAMFTRGGVDQISKAIKETAPKIGATIAGIRAHSPHARILVVNYLDGVPLNGKGCWNPDVPVTDTDMAYFAAKFQEMNAMIASVARSSHVELVDTFTPTVGHDACKAPGVRYAEGLVPLSTQNALLAAFPFHPNQGGANAQTHIVYAAITGRTAS